MDFKFDRKEKKQLMEQDDIFIITTSIAYQFNFEDIKSAFQDSNLNCVFCHQQTRRKAKNQFLAHLGNPNNHGGRIRVKPTPEGNRIATIDDWKNLKSIDEERKQTPIANYPTNKPTRQIKQEPAALEENFELGSSQPISFAINYKMTTTKYEH